MDVRVGNVFADVHERHLDFCLALAQDPVHKPVAKGLQAVLHIELPHLSNLFEALVAWPAVDRQLVHLFLHVNEPGSLEPALELGCSHERPLGANAGLDYIAAPHKQRHILGQGAIIAVHHVLELLALEPTTGLQAGKRLADDVVVHIAPAAGCEAGVDVV